MLRYETPFGTFNTYDQAAHAVSGKGFDPGKRITIKIAEPGEQRLSDCFDAVANPDDWRAPIDAIVEAVDLNDTIQAVIHYTASTPIIVDDGPGKYRLYAQGYRAGPAGP